MMLPDLANGLFEAVGGISLWRNCAVILRDKEVRGVDWRTTAFFAAWGLWNLYYYPSLHQWMSFSGGLVIVSANITWVVLAVRYGAK